MSETTYISIKINLGTKPLPSDILATLRYDLLGSRVSPFVASVEEFTNGVATVNAEIFDLEEGGQRDLQSIVQSWIDRIYGPSSSIPSEDLVERSSGTESETESSSGPTEEDNAKRDAEIARMLADHPEYVSQIEEARISGSPLHLVAANISEKEGAKSSSETTEDDNTASVAEDIANTAVKLGEVLGTQSTEGQEAS
jgi:hypothetical protein